MKTGLWRIIALVVVAAVVSTSFTVPFSVDAADQAHSRVDFFSNPPNVSFYAVEWNKQNYYYAIAVGIDTNTLHGVIYRYEPDIGWTLLYTASAADTYREVIYDTHLNTDTFYVLGTDGTYSLVLTLENAGGNASVSYFGKRNVRIY